MKKLLVFFALIVSLLTYQFLIIILIKSLKFLLSLQMADSDYINHQLNKSMSKSAYTFAKGIKISNPKRLYTDTFYNVPQSKLSSYCTFGFGNKIDFANKAGNPSPDKYHLTSSFTSIDQHQPKKGFSFGSGRTDTTFKSFLAKALKKQQIPGPASYGPKSSIKKKAVTMRKKYENIQQRKAPTPGPGSYNTMSYSNKFTGYYINSRQKNVRPVQMKGNGHISLQEKNVLNLGPGQYNISHEKIGIYFESTNTSNLIRTFGKSKKIDDSQQKSKEYIPGPGEYPIFSQFGQPKHLKKFSVHQINQKY